MPLARLVPAGPRADAGRRWTVAASAALHGALFAVLLGIAARRPPPEPAGAPSYELVFDAGNGAPGAPAPQTAQPSLPPLQQAEVPAPDDVPPGPPAPSPLSPPAPDAAPSPAPESAVASAAPSAPLPSAPASAAAPAPLAAAPPVPLAFAPPAPAPEAIAPPPPPEPDEILPETEPPAVRLELPQAPRAAAPPAPILHPPPALPPMPARPRPQSRPAPGTLANPMDLSFGPAAPRPAPAARGSVASRAIDLSPGPPVQGARSSDPYAEIRAKNASADWNRGLRTFWLRHRYYPREAAAAGEDGTVMIELTVARSGKVEAVEVVSRSGSQWLDMAAVGTFRSAQLPPFTPEMTQDRITFTIPITYYLIR